MNGVAIVLFIGATVILAAQQSEPKFEVASVKPTPPGDQSYLLAFRNGRYVARGQTLNRLIRSAFATPGGPLTPNQVAGGPEWLDVDRFDVEATAPGTPDAPNGAIPPVVSRMLRQLLAERFSLRAHLETTERPVFALVLARQDAQFGPGLRRRVTDCVPAPIGIAPAPGDNMCMGKMGPGSLAGIGLNMPILVNALSQFIPEVDRMVVDRTGLTGTYDVDLRWTPDTATRAGDYPSFFAALQEQLGLRLERSSGPVDVLVIDSVERPTPN